MPTLIWTLLVGAPHAWSGRLLVGESEHAHPVLDIACWRMLALLGNCLLKCDPYPDTACRSAMAFIRKLLVSARQLSFKTCL